MSGPAAPVAKDPSASSALSAVSSLLLAVVAAALFVFPIFRVDWWATHNLDVTPALATEFRAGLAAGDPYPRWCPDLARGLGYPFFDFYSPGFFYLTAGLAAAGLDTLDALKLACALAVFAGALGAGRLALELAGEAAAGGAGGIPVAAASIAVYVFAPYAATNLYVRGDVAELAAGGILPWFLLGVERIARRRAADGLAGPVALAAIAYALLAATHAITGVIGGYLAAVVLAVRLRGRPRPEVEEALAWAGAALLAGVLLAGAWAWPARVDQALVSAGALTSGGLNILNNGARPAQVLDPRTWLASARHLGMSLSIGLAALVALAAALARAGLRGRPGEPEPERALRAWTWIAVLAIPCTFSGAVPVWHLPLARFAQFPWRLLLPISLGAALAAGLLVAARPAGRGRALLALAFAALAVGPGLERARVEEPMSRADLPLTREAIPAASRRWFLNDEFLPRTAPRDWRARIGPEEMRVACGPGADAAVLERGYARWSLAVHATAPAWLRVPQFWYPGFVASRIETGSGIAGELTTSADDLGLIRVDLPRGACVVEVVWRGTDVHRRGAWISLAGAIALACAVLGAAYRGDRARAAG